MKDSTVTGYWCVDDFQRNMALNILYIAKLTIMYKYERTTIFLRLINLRPAKYYEAANFSKRQSLLSASLDS